jgi:hypothetical protein
MNDKISGVIVRHVSGYRERAAVQPACATLPNNLSRCEQ